MSIKRIIAIALLVAVAAPAMLYPIEARGFIGAAVVTDPGHTFTTIGGWVAEATRWLADRMLAVLLETLRKRLFDALVDSIISWIQGGFDGSPQFITDPGRMFTDAYQAAIGDTVIELGAAQLCQPGFGVHLRAMLRPDPLPFSQIVSCTLDDVVSNLNTFRDDFRQGKWIALQRSFLPQNNILGLQIMVRNEVLAKAEVGADLARSEVEMGQGYTSTRRCMEWTAVRRDGSVIGTLTEGQDGFSKEIHNPPETPLPEGARWQCTKTDVTVPGATVAAGAERSVFSDLDFIISAQELEAYAAAIVDALFNQLVSMGVDGLLGTFSREQDRSCEDMPPGPARDACIEYRDERSSRMQEQDDMKSDLENRQAALSAIQAAITEARALENTMLSLINAYETLKQEVQELETLGCPASISIFEIDGRISELRNVMLELKQRAESMVEALENLANIDPDLARETADSLRENFKELRDEREDELANVNSDTEIIRGEKEVCMAGANENGNGDE